jgi:cation:H+ antiporter
MRLVRRDARRGSTYSVAGVLLHFALLLVGGSLLYFGAEWLVRGAAGLARSFGVRSIVVGLTVVGYGTSAPEMTVSISASLRGSAPIALGNVVGSNIANLGLILGMTALIAPPHTDGSLIRRELPLLLATAVALPLLLLDGRISRVEGFALLATAVLFTLVLVRGSRSMSVDTSAMEDAAESAGAIHPKSRGALAAWTILGLMLLVVGGELFVRGAIALARSLSISERVIALTVVAVGTSLPELATSLVAASRGHSDLAVGNVVGSNLYNVLLVLGGAAAIRPVAGNLREMRVDLCALAVMTFVAVVFLRTRRRLQRWEGALLVLGYVAFLVALLLRL